MRILSDLASQTVSNDRHMDTSVTFSPDVTPELSNPHFKTIFKICVSLSHLFFHTRRKLGLLQGLILFNIFTGDMDTGIKSTLSMFANDTKLSGANTLEGSDAIQRDLHRLESQVLAKLRKFNKAD